MPATLDEALDFLGAEYAVRIPTADLLYSSPYDALITKDTTGGWVDVQKIGDQSCDHLSYHQEVVDWEIWLGPEHHFPCQLKITYKKDPGQPSTTVTFHGMETSQVTDDTFAAKIPDGYQRENIASDRQRSQGRRGAIQSRAAETPHGTEEEVVGQ